jgi:hypothetical protein
MVMTKEELVEKIKQLLGTGDDLAFLLQLRLKDLETLIANIRERVDLAGR